MYVCMYVQNNNVLYVSYQVRSCFTYGGYGVTRPTSQRFLNADM